MKLKAFKAAFPHTVPVLLGYIFLGIAFGVLLSSNGFGVGWAFVMSILIYAGSMQFVAVNLLISAFNPVAAFIMTIMVNARHLFYGLSMLGKFKPLKKFKPYMIFSLTDETYSIFCNIEVPEDVDKDWFMFFIAILDHSYWIAGSVIGALAGSLLTFDSTGIEFSMTALFICIFVEQWEKAGKKLFCKEHLPAVLGVVITIICRLIFGVDNFIVAAMLGIVIFLCVLRPMLGGEKK